MKNYEDTSMVSKVHQTVQCMIAEARHIIKPTEYVNGRKQSNYL